MVLLFQGLAKGTFFPFQHLFDWNVTSASQNLALCPGVFWLHEARAAVGGVFLSDEVWSSFSEERERAEAANSS